MAGAFVTFAGGALGLGLTALALPLLLQLDTTNTSPTRAVALDWRAAAASLAMAAIVIAAATAAALARVARQDLASSFAGLGLRTIGSRGHARFGSWLVGVQTAIVLVLLVSGALLLTAFDRTARTNPGFDPNHLFGAQLRFTETSYPTQDARTAFVRAVLDRVRAVPGVVSASTTLNFFIPGFAIQTLVQVEGQPTPTGQGYTVLFHRISPGYFETMRIPVLEGRAIDDHDIATTMPVAVVSRQFAAKFWPGASAVGRRLQRGGATSPWITIVGVAGDVSDAGFSQARSRRSTFRSRRTTTRTAPSASSSARPAIRPAWSGRFARRCGRSIPRSRSAARLRSTNSWTTHSGRSDSARRCS